MGHDYSDAAIEFTETTGASRDIADAYLESCEGDLDLAVANYYDALEMDRDGAEEDEGEMDVDDDQAKPTPATARPLPVISAPRPSSGNTLSGSAPSAMPAGWGSQSSSANTSRSASPANRNPMRSNQAPRVSTLRDLNSGPAAPPPRTGGVGRVPHNNSDDDDDGPDEQLEFFTGGEKSGLSVENPNARRAGAGRPNDMIKGILEKAKAGGERGELSPAAGAAQARSLFGGTAHTLGSDDTPSVVIPDPTGRARAAGPPGAFPGMQQDDADEVEEETAVRTLIFWEDGFSIEDGDLMRYDDPQNEQVLAAINTGRAPLALLKVRHDQPVELRIAKRLTEKWTRQPSAPAGPFAGSGNRLGAVSVAGDSVAAAAPDAPASRGIPIAATLFEVDATLPTTTLQIRLRNGERLIAKFNHSHTIGDIRRYIDNSQPGDAGLNYALQTTFPSKDLVDENQTIVDAGIIGSVIVQRGL